MKFKTVFLIFNLAVLCLIQTGCKRTASDVWEDTKTCGRQLGKGIRSLAGNYSVSRQVASPEDFRGPYDHDFIPLRDYDINERINLARSNQPTNAPGEEGSPIPGIDSFTTPRTPEQQRAFKKVFFQKNEYAIQGGDNRDSVTRVADYIQSHPRTYVFVEGHCCESGSAAYNLALGVKRANAVRNQLIKEGVDPDHLFTISYGKERPAVLGHDEGSLSQNRRVEYKLYDR